MLIFVYGSLLDLAWLRQKAGDPQLQLIPARVTGWHRVPRGRYPTLMRGGWVDGALVRVPARALGRLMGYEGHEYRLMAVTARAGKSHPCLVWIK